jgi:class 3 adenylate cyclase
VGGWAQVLKTRVAREATVLFIDIKGFTAGCAQMTVAQVAFVLMLSANVAYNIRVQ